MAFASYKVENDKAFQGLIDKAFKETRDLTIPFRQIVRVFYESRKAIFKLSTNGAYPDFKGKTIGQGWSRDARPSDIARRTRPQGATPYEWFKVRKLGPGNQYPLLKLSGRLEGSITNPNHPDAEQKIDAIGLTIITKVPYANYHQQDNPDLGDKVIPTRKFFFIGGETSQSNRDIERYTKIINDHIVKVLAKRL
jgi:phage gpG-like protein